MRKKELSGYAKTANEFGQEAFPFFMWLVEQIEEHQPDNIRAHFYTEKGYSFYLGALRLDKAKKKGAKK